MVLHKPIESCACMGVMVSCDAVAGSSSGDGGGTGGGTGGGGGTVTYYNAGDDCANHREQANSTRAKEIQQN